jgi:hypothetical protein
MNPLSSSILFSSHQRHKRHANMVDDDVFGPLVKSYPQLETKSVAAHSSDRSTFVNRQCNRARFDPTLGWALSSSSLKSPSSSSSTSSGGGGEIKNKKFPEVGGSLCSSQAFRRLLVAFDFVERSPELMVRISW